MNVDARASGVGRGWYRGGRLLSPSTVRQPSNMNSEEQDNLLDGMVAGRGTWVRGNRIGLGAAAPSFSYYNQQFKTEQKEEWPPLVLRQAMSQPPPPPPPLSQQQQYQSTIQQLTMAPPPPPPPPARESASPDSLLTNRHRNSATTPNQWNRPANYNKPPSQPQFSYKRNYQQQQFREQQKQPSLHKTPWARQRQNEVFGDCFHRRGDKRSVPLSPPNAQQGKFRSAGGGGGGQMQYSNKKKNKQKKSDTNIVKDSRGKPVVNEALLALRVTEQLSFEGQATELISQLEQTETDRKMRLEVLKDVAETFSPYLPQVEPQIFGSSLTNLAFKTSDLDIFLYCPTGQPDYNFVKKDGRVMYKSNKFKNVVRVPKARVPVIKATHVATNIDLDISTMSGQAVYNSMLVRHIMASDSRFRSLAMLISLWAKLNNLSGQDRFTSYSITLMVLYFLQNTDPPMLPPLKEIIFAEEDWEWPNFIRQDKPLSHDNKSDLSTLFKDFFSFHAKLNYSEYVFSTYLGMAIPASHFINISSLPEEMNTYRCKIAKGFTPFLINNTMHIQDPMEHNINTTKGMFDRLLKLWQRCCLRMVSICSNNTNPNKWLPLMLKLQPLKLAGKNKEWIVFKYPSEDYSSDWFESCKQELRTLLKVMLIRVCDEECDVQEDFMESAEPTKDTFSVEADYNIFYKKFRFPLKMYMTGVIPLAELQKQFQLVINRKESSSSSLFKADVIVECVNRSLGHVKLSFVDKNSASNNCFSFLIAEMRKNFEKFINDIILEDKETEKKCTVVNCSMDNAKGEGNKKIKNEKPKDTGSNVKKENIDQTPMDLVDEIESSKMEIKEIISTAC